jgi:hypothetical protein
LNQLDARNLLVLSVPQISEEQLLYKPLWDLAIANHRSNAVLSNASRPGLTVRSFGGEHRVFMNEGVTIYRMAPMSPLTRTTSNSYTDQTEVNSLDRGYFIGEFDRYSI